MSPSFANTKANGKADPSPDNAGAPIRSHHSVGSPESTPQQPRKHTQCPGEGWAGLALTLGFARCLFKLLCCYSRAPGPEAAKAALRCPAVAARWQRTLAEQPLDRAPPEGAGSAWNTRACPRRTYYKTQQRSGDNCLHACRNTMCVWLAFFFFFLLFSRASFEQNVPTITIAV